MAKKSINKKDATRWEYPSKKINLFAGVLERRTKRDE
jgi:hypothetical protein